jgi:predicted transcriptional regulator
MDTSKATGRPETSDELEIRVRQGIPPDGIRQKWSAEMVKHDAVEAGVLRSERGEVIPMEAGPCLFCWRYVEEGRDMAGATRPFDPCWQANGDFGCDDSPECGHFRPYDAALLRLKPKGYDATA